MEENKIKKEWQMPKLAVMDLNTKTNAGSGQNNLDAAYENS